MSNTGFLQVTYYLSYHQTNIVKALKGAQSTDFIFSYPPQECPDWGALLPLLWHQYWFHWCCECFFVLCFVGESVNKITTESCSR